MFCFWGEYVMPGPVGDAPLVAAVLVVEVLRQLLDHLELPGLVLVVSVTNSRLDDIFVHRARRREAEVALEVVLGHLEVGVVLGRVHVEDVLRVPGRRAARLEDEALAGGRYAVLRLASKKTMSRKKKSLAVSRVDWRRRRRDESSHEAH